MEKLLQYNLVTQIYEAALQIPMEQFCNGFTCKNIGTANVVIMGDTLAPGESKAFGGNRGEVYIGRADLKFSGAGTTAALITQKFYVNIPQNSL
jgi:hypothetical protein